MDQRITTAFKRTIYSFMALIVLVFAPASYVLAEGVNAPASSTVTCSPVVAAPNGVSSPTGSDATTYTYNSCTGLWENAYYTWSPATGMATPKQALEYTCNTQTWKWVTKVWEYDPAAHSFYQAPVTQSVLPTGAVIAPDSLVACAPAPAIAPVSNSSYSPTTNQQTAGVASTAQTGSALSSATNATIQNNLLSNATSGNANVLRNATGGNATAGNASAQATVLNNVQSSSALTGPNVIKFVANVDGNVQGDLIIDPSKLQPATTSDALRRDNTITVNNQDTGTIQNQINLAAKSGDAVVADNTTGGSATTGNATAIANVVNMLNSLVSAGQSFIGTVNINGNLNGNILVPQSLVDSLVASNAPSTTVNLDAAQANSLGMTNTTNQAITNTLHLTAVTGAANVTDNTTAGNAATGNATTKVTIFNLTGNQIVGANCLLVFVNVSGQWVGMIMNAPGATAAAIGSGITTNTVKDAALTNNTNNAITNDITTAAASGDASVAGNTTAGNARSGNANTAVNLLNVNASELSLTGWFGILFINVFGNWYGNFGAFTPQPPDHTSGGNQPGDASSSPAAPPHQPFTFVTQDTTRPSAAPAAENPFDTPLPEAGAVLAATSSRAFKSDVNHVRTAAQTTAAGLHITIQEIVSGILVLSGILIVVIDRLASRRSNRTTPRRLR